ncbi:MAG: phenylalanine--tRNA ligase subunit beta [Clostridiales Family XIII bacterium]|jgi:phenylalanyl-tRNA synthetase beta chain|nr:phenylalanine--tRNA ligase subunit beta [Clostridiales Family XIII bacterium]
MLVPVSWLKEYTDIDADAREFADSMILSGSNIETVETFGEEISNVVVGRVLEVRDHEDSDHLHVCMVDVGAASEDAGPIQIVCGAANVAPGILVPVALHGSTLPGGVKIKKGKLRGVLSNGMICAAQELGFDDKVTPVRVKDGIWALPEDADIAPGDDIVEALALGETVIDFEITPNRPDCLSIIGMAREAAATFGSRLIYPDTDIAGADTSEDAASLISVDIEKPELCPRYVARVAEDIVIKDSPWWLQRRLMFAGMRPINNIVDITNYVMLEYGHPIHAFDIRTIEGGRIIIDTASDGEVFTTLDGSERKMSPDMLLIKDAKKGVAVAGVMGGQNSEIEDDTTTILVEAANFNADSVRKTSKKLGVRTEASSRYEKGVSAELSDSASKRVCALISLTNSGRVLTGSVDAYPGRTDAKPIKIRISRMNQILGTGLGSEEIEEILKRLEMTVTAGSTPDELLVTPHHVRVDLKEEIDFTEEIARIYGYDRLGTTQHKDNAEAAMSGSWRLRGISRDILTGIGFSEIQTYSFVSPGGVLRLGLAEDSPKRSFVKIINPLGEENSVMRTTLLPNLLDVLQTNYNHSNDVARLFEIGNTFISNGPDSLPGEQLNLSVGFYGGDYDFFYLKGAVLSLLARIGIKGVLLEAAADTGAWHPGRCALLTIKGGNNEPGSKAGSKADSEAAPDIRLGYIGEIHPDVRKSWDISTPVYAAELDFDAIAANADLMRYYEPLGKYPQITLDISVLADEDVTVGQVENIAKANGGKLLRSVRLFDVYRGRQIPEGKKSLSFSLAYRADDHTLTDEEAGKVHEKILSAIETETGATLRAL